MKFTQLLHLIFVSFWLNLVMARSPTGGYAPGRVQCPSNTKSFMRQANSISQDEKDWVEERHAKTDLAIAEFLQNSNLTDFDLESFMDDAEQSINLGLAFSGGGYRAMLLGAGQLAAFDNRTNDVSSTKGLGGIFQSSTYLAGLSGGAWLVGSLALQDYPSIDEIVFENPDDVWNLTTTRQIINQTSIFSIVTPIIFGNYEKALTHLNNYYSSRGSDEGIGKEMQAKQNAGFVTSLTDYWGRGLARQLFPRGKNNFNSASTWSDLRNSSSFKNHDQPFPLLSSLARKPESVTYDLNSTVVEFNAFEMGSFDYSLNSFTDTKYVGTQVRNGRPVNGSCVEGFDNAAFVIGTSSSIFNEFLNTLVCDDCHTLNFVLKRIVKHFLDKLSKVYFDIATYKPNPFYRSEFANSDDLTHNETLFLMDGGLGGESIPLSSLMTKERALDVVFAMDNSDKWPNGSSLVSTYKRQFSKQGASTICPYVPGESTFLKSNLTAKPTFFGCEASNLTNLTKGDVVPPLVIYIANRPFEYWSNTSTFKMLYNDTEKKGMIKNGFDVASRLNNTLDDEWQSCVACALIKREQERQDIEQTDQCKKCFKRYCWDGTTYDAKTYYKPVNFTKDGLTNDSMDLWNQADAYTAVSNDTTISTWLLDIKSKRLSGSSIKLSLTSSMSYILWMALIVASINM